MAAYAGASPAPPMPLFQPIGSDTAGAALPAAAVSPVPDGAVLLAYARMLQREALMGSRQPWLLGKNIGLFGDAGPADEVALFRRSATELGANVAEVRPFDGDTLTADKVRPIARLISRLYDAVEWPGAPAGLLQQIRSVAGIPVYDGLAAAAHPTARLADLLGSEASPDDRRRVVVQAVLLATII